MNKDQARKLIRDTFQGGFDKDKFVKRRGQDTDRGQAK